MISAIKLLQREASSLPKAFEIKTKDPEFLNQIFIASFYTSFLEKMIEKCQPKENPRKYLILSRDWMKRESLMRERCARLFRQEMFSLNFLPSAAEHPFYWRYCEFSLDGGDTFKEKYLEYFVESVLTQRQFYTLVFNCLEASVLIPTDGDKMIFPLDIIQTIERQINKEVKTGIEKIWQKFIENQGSVPLGNVIEEVVKFKVFLIDVEEGCILNESSFSYLDYRKKIKKAQRLNLIESKRCKKEEKYRQEYEQAFVNQEICGLAVFQYLTQLSRNKKKNIQTLSLKEVQEGMDLFYPILMKMYESSLKRQAEKDTTERAKALLAEEEGDKLKKVKERLKKEKTFIPNLKTNLCSTQKSVTAAHSDHSEAARWEEDVAADVEEIGFDPEENSFLELFSSVKGRGKKKGRKERLDTSGITYFANLQEAANFLNRVAKNYQAEMYQPILRVLRWDVVSREEVRGFNNYSSNRKYTELSKEELDREISYHRLSGLKILWSSFLREQYSFSDTFYNEHKQQECSCEGVLALRNECEEGIISLGVDPDRRHIYHIYFTPMGAMGEGSDPKLWNFVTRIQTAIKAHGVGLNAALSTPEERRAGGSGEARTTFYHYEVVHHPQLVSDVLRLRVTTFNNQTRRTELTTTYDLCPSS